MLSVCLFARTSFCLLTRSSFKKKKHGKKNQLSTSINRSINTVSAKSLFPPLHQTNPSSTTDITQVNITRRERTPQSPLGISIHPSIRVYITAKTPEYPTPAKHQSNQHTSPPVPNPAPPKPSAQPPTAKNNSQYDSTARAPTTPARRPVQKRAHRTTQRMQATSSEPHDSPYQRWMWL